MVIIEALTVASLGQGLAAAKPHFTCIFKHERWIWISEKPSWTFFSPIRIYPAQLLILPGLASPD
jgi:hypothetical protein